MASHQDPSSVRTDSCERDYASLRALLQQIPPTADADVRMIAFCDAAWESFGTKELRLDQEAQSQDRSISWIGFYTISKDASTGEPEMVLAHRRNKPACSPIGMTGACGQSFCSRTTLVVTDVAHLGGGYIACDPMDRSELVLPLIDAHNTCIGVLDADSYALGAFTERDAVSMHQMLVLAGLTANAAPPIHVV